jgi:hypothetical protein
MGFILRARILMMKTREAVERIVEKQLASVLSKKLLGRAVSRLRLPSFK